MNHRDPQYLLAETLSQARGRWRGCDWTTNFGRFGFNLKGIRSRQAQVLADATCGNESDCWMEAYRWLSQVERDARAAESAAQSAVKHVQAHDLESALSCIQYAEAMESKYRQACVWSPMTSMITQLYHASQPDSSHV